MTPSFRLKWSSSITMTLTTVAERLSVELSLPTFTTWVCCGWDSNTQPSKHSKKTLLPTAPRRLSFCERLINSIEFYAVSAIFSHGTAAILLKVEHTVQGHEFATQVNISQTICPDNILCNRGNLNSPKQRHTAMCLG